MRSAHVDFDLGDEFILEEFGKAEGGRLQVGERAYEAVVIPPLMENACRSTVDLLEAFLQSGGQVYVTGAPLQLVDGRPESRTSSVTPMTLWVSSIIAARPPPRSTTTVSCPRRVVYSAVWSPAGPPPTTTTS